MKPLCIVNPNAGGGRTGRTFEQWRHAVEGALGPSEFVQTESHGDGIRIAQDGALAGYDRVLAFGGDGTVNEVATGLLRSGKTDVTLGVVAQGTGGDFRRSLGFEHRLDRYLHAVRAEHVRTVDAGELRYHDHHGQPQTRHFVNVLSAGMGGLVDQYVATASRSFGSTLAYFGASVRALANAKRGHLKVHGEGPDGPFEARVSSLMFAICNGRYFGSGMKVAPRAELDDGVFEIVSLTAPTKLGFALYTKDIYAGTHLRTAQSFRASRISVDLENEEARSSFLLDVDGEPLGTLPLEVRALPRALRVFAPPN